MESQYDLVADQLPEPFLPTFQELQILTLFHTDFFLNVFSTLLEFPCQILMWILLIQKESEFLNMFEINTVPKELPKSVLFELWRLELL